MAAKIRLKRTGTKNRPYYRVVVIDESKARKGREIEIVGSYSPVEKSDRYKFNGEKILEWIKKGATPSERVRILLGKAGILPHVSFEGVPKKKPKSEQKQAAPEGAAPQAEAPGPEKPEQEKAEESKETPKAEKPEQKKAEEPKDEKKTEKKEEAKEAPKAEKPAEETAKG